MPTERPPLPSFDPDAHEISPHTLNALNQEIRELKEAVEEQKRLVREKE
jgi:hypothetical protein